MDCFVDSFRVFDFKVYELAFFYGTTVLICMLGILVSFWVGC